MGIEHKTSRILDVPPLGRPRDRMSSDGNLDALLASELGAQHVGVEQAPSSRAVPP